ncbi:Prostaglandin E synthase 2 [Lamellibrachia satsuma]|nr:Prostaglandin E synthase 2 [Lamellibrachia satsuma]
MQLGDSSMSLSVLETYFQDMKQPIEKVVSYYPIIEEKTKKGKTVFDFPNKYFVMFGEKDVKTCNMDGLKQERKWRRWNDEVLMHIITPNLYRTVSEARTAVSHFAEVGDWKENIDKRQFWLIMNVGPYAMYTLGKVLKSKYKLKPEVRLSLYDECDRWVQAVGKKNPFLGGDRPNLADLSVYGTLSCMEGCPVFEDMMANTAIGQWYGQMRQAVNNHDGARLLAGN